MQDMKHVNEKTALRLFKLVVGNTRFNKTKFTRFYTDQYGGNYNENYRTVKTILAGEIERGTVELVDEKRQMMKFVTPELKLPGYVKNNHGMVGKPFNEVSALQIKRILREDFYKCPYCEYVPEFVQSEFIVASSTGLIGVIVCPACNRIITETS